MELLRGAAYLALAVMSAVTFVLFGVDKKRAVQGEYRVRERTLLLCALLMGAPGALLGMRVFRHKTRKPRFQVLVPLALVLNLAVIAAVTL